MEAQDDARLHGRRAERAVLLPALQRVLPRIEDGKGEQEDVRPERVTER